MNVYEQTQNYLEIIFKNFDNIIISFSGGKDSGLMAQLVFEYKIKHNLDNRIILYHQDMEAQYSTTTEFVELIYQKYEGIYENQWTCLPLKVECATSQQWWYPWDTHIQDRWCRELPENVLTEKDCEWFKKGMTTEESYIAFNDYIAKNSEGLTICLVGIRTEESLNRWRAIHSSRKGMFKDYEWTTKKGDSLYNGYPVWNWTTQDVWIAHAKNNFDYNRIYDLMHHAGIPLHKMRVASPYHIDSINTLSTYRVLDPQSWVKVVNRVDGANFANIYGGTKALGYRTIDLPEGHTWKSYCKFLLATLPDDLRENYIKKFVTSLKFWNKTGGVLGEETIKELEENNYRIKGYNSSNRSDKKAVTFHKIPDHSDNIKEFQLIPSWKRMCICILKNDHLCKYMGFAPTKDQALKRKKAVEKWENLI